MAPRKGQIGRSRAFGSQRVPQGAPELVGNVFRTDWYWTGAAAPSHVWDGGAYGGCWAASVGPRSTAWSVAVKASNLPRPIPLTPKNPILGRWLQAPLVFTSVVEPDESGAFSRVIGDDAQGTAQERDHVEVDLWRVPPLIIPSARAPLYLGSAAAVSSMSYTKLRGRKRIIAWTRLQSGTPPVTISYSFVALHSLTGAGAPFTAPETVTDTIANVGDAVAREFSPTVFRSGMFHGLVVAASGGTILTTLEAWDD